MHPPQLQPPPPPPVQPPPPALTTRTTNSLKLAEAEEIDPLTLGVPGLKTLIPGDRVEVLWRHGAASLLMLALTAAPINSRHTARGRAGCARTEPLPPTPMPPHPPYPPPQQQPPEFTQQQPPQPQPQPLPQPRPQTRVALQTLQAIMHAFHCNDAACQLINCAGNKQVCGDRSP